MVTAIEGSGTGEDIWRGWSAPAAWPVLDPAAVPDLVVVAPHPDDEVLGVGGLLVLLENRPGSRAEDRVERRVEIVAVTDGEASHPGSTALAPADLAPLRRRETAAALAALGSTATVLHLGQPDGQVDEVALTDVLVDRLAPGSWCLATWRGDGHPDHEAVGRAAAAACAAVGARLLEYPVWTWHWALPDDPQVPWDRALRIDLPEGVAAAKRAAAAEFGSQVRPLGPDPADRAVLPPHVLARLLRGHEVVFG